MKILILNGNPKPSDFDEKLLVYSQTLNTVHKTEVLQLRDMQVEYCKGCWGCWVKEPGRCVFEDDSQIVREKIVNSDFILFASPLIYGYVSALTKKVMDKIVPLLLPYITFIEGESHHKKRFDKYPDIGLVYQRENDTDQEDINILKDLFARLCLNFHADFLLFDEIEDVELESIMDEPIKAEELK